MLASFVFLVFERHVRTWHRNLHNVCDHVLWFQRNVACCVWFLGSDADEACFYSSKLTVELWVGDCHVVGAGLLSLLVAVQKVIVSIQPRCSTKRVSWSRVQCLSTPFDVRSRCCQLNDGLQGRQPTWTVSCQTVLTRRHWMIYDIGWFNWLMEAIRPLSYVLIRYINCHLLYFTILTCSVKMCNIMHRPNITANSYW